MESQTVPNSIGFLSTDTRLSRSELRELAGLASSLRTISAGRLSEEEQESISTLLREISRTLPCRDRHGLPFALLTLRTAVLFAESVEPDHDILVAILLFPVGHLDPAKSDGIRKRWGADVAGIIAGMQSVMRFGAKTGVRNADNYRGLLLSLADDIRVIITMIVHNVVLMRAINHHPDTQWVRDVAFEAEYLYAQLAHRLGLYKLKSELEDLALKYTNREIYTQIARKLNETKRARDAYIADFIAPVKKKLTEAGLRFSIKGRTKSISSIWAKIRKQKVDLQHIYDLFAIRVIIDTPREREKRDCWLAYSILADMYTANPARMKDWITIPKSNGYESLHATVMGPQSKWVEVQFRTKRMDLVAEKGLAAHWRYKGVKGDSTDQWMNNIRDILETAESGPMQLMKDIRPDAYDKEVFAFTPKGDLLRLSPGATVLDFAFAIHSNVGCRCTGAIIDGVHRKLNHRIANGDTVEIVTSANQSPSHDWLSFVATSKAKNKIRQSLNEAKLHKAELGKELLERRAKNRKTDLDEAAVMRVIKRMGYKFNNDFFAALADEEVDAAKFLTIYEAEADTENEAVKVSAEEYRFKETQEEDASTEILTIDGKTMKGLKYKLAKCCSPIFGDDVFGFVSSDGVIKVHHKDCPNATNIRKRYPYRIIDVEWNGSPDTQLPVTLKVIGNDDIGIVTNITSIIAKEPGMGLRNIAIDSHDGVFQGYLTINITDTGRLNSLIRKLKGVKGVKDAART